MAPTPWQVGGNANTNPPADFLGTTDNQPLVVKTDGAERLRVAADGNVGIGAANPGRWPLSIQAKAGAQEFDLVAVLLIALPRADLQMLPPRLRTVDLRFSGVFVTVRSAL
jgi:hypothetical protein